MVRFTKMSNTWYACDASALELHHEGEDVDGDSSVSELFSNTKALAEEGNVVAFCDDFETGCAALELDEDDVVWVD